MTDIKIDSDAMNVIVSKAILEGIDADQRAAIMEQAVTALLKAPKDNYGRTGVTPLQAAFERAVQSVVNDVAREVVEESPELRDKVRELVKSAMADALKEPYTKLSDAVRNAVAENIVTGY